jgi:CheY-like chemotaxis protein
MFAYEADSALATVRAERPDVVVSDIGMPGTDGYGLVRKIRMLSAAAGGRTPCLAVTAYARGADAERAFSAGFQMHVAKPIDPDRLVLAVASLAGLPLDGGQGGGGEERRTP